MVTKPWYIKKPTSSVKKTALVHEKKSLDWIDPRPIVQRLAEVSPHLLHLARTRTSSSIRHPAGRRGTASCGSGASGDGVVYGQARGGCGRVVLRGIHERRGLLPPLRPPSVPWPPVRLDTAAVEVVGVSSSVGSVDAAARGASCH
jgi:hypothetical protein